MNYQLTIAIKQRKCSMCSAKIDKATKLFVMSDWPRNQDYPTKKNICLDCAPKLTDPSFVGYLRALLKELEHLEDLQKITLQKLDFRTIYECAECKGEVSYEETFERFQCKDGCGQLYELDEVKDLKLHPRYT